MNVFLLFMLGSFFLAMRSSSDKPARALPLLAACVVVAVLLSSYRFA